MIRTGLLGGSFNPAHHGHRHISLHALDAMGLDEVWWLVSPGNPLKAGVPDMAPMAARYASARRMAARARIRPTTIEARLGTRYTADTLKKLVRRYPNRRFVWIMGADNLVQFHRWRDWRVIARTVTIAVVARPEYDGPARASRAMGWLRRFVRPASQARQWTTWSPPALVLLRFYPDPASATQLRAANPRWHLSYNQKGPDGAAAPSIPVHQEAH
ncbi:nicotinate-nucleotide adenylyltransferase [Sphingomonas montanisoli]|uniref:Probable nicotinate-nucleotide adenylyltransferase n=1 Tax=Sphingomonas montanisoli TaxID=2606412 RepID=A0A5D9C461_9SPHN|nr:nicotinate-nucleotide adenylyltransferase [Sphingomonas montanisoli]TZG26253.1 nicotinate-nucleotide adenylyltransferase [Sphingomonas montanisoli]